jgi:serine/threonine-protein kinase
MFHPGQIIKDTYRVERRLGAGGMAEVYLVSHTRLPRQFALKLMLVDMDGRKDFLERFRREAEVLAKLRHPHIVDVNDWDFLDGRPYLVMEYLEGETLDTFLHRTGPLSVPVALDICAQIGQALDATHAAGIVHRDLKPSNIFLDKNGNRPNFVKILDFGIAKMERVDTTPLTAQSAIMGTPGYMAPEQALGHTGEIDHRTDQFALAAILYEMLAGHPAFYSPGDAVYSILARIVTEAVPPLPNEHMNRALQRALSKKAVDRFPSLQAFLVALTGKDATLILLPQPYAPQSTVGTGESTRPSPVTSSRPWSVVKRWGAPVLAAAVIITGLGVWKSITGANPKQAEIIRLCINRTLKSVSLPLNTMFEFERSATLKVVKWPDAYYPAELQLCLRDAFTVSSTSIPTAITIRLTPARR